MLFGAAIMRRTEEIIREINALFYPLELCHWNDTVFRASMQKKYNIMWYKPNFVNALKFPKVIEDYIEYRFSSFGDGAQPEDYLLLLIQGCLLCGAERFNFKVWKYCEERLYSYHQGTDNLVYYIEQVFPSNSNTYYRSEFDGIIIESTLLLWNPEYRSKTFENILPILQEKLTNDSFISPDYSIISRYSKEEVNAILAQFQNYFDELKA